MATRLVSLVSATTNILQRPNTQEQSEGLTADLSETGRNSLREKFWGWTAMCQIHISSGCGREINLTVVFSLMTQTCCILLFPVLARAIRFCPSNSLSTNFQLLPFQNLALFARRERKTDICSQIEVSRDDGLPRLTAGFHPDLFSPLYNELKTF